MKQRWLIMLFGIGLVSFTGCYTQLTIQNDYMEDEEPIIIPYPPPSPPPSPCPCPRPFPPSDPPEDSSDEPVYKYRNQQKDRPNESKDKDRIRNTSGRNNLTERGKVRR